MDKKSKLGRGLDALLGSSVVNFDLANEGESKDSLPIEILQRGKFQPRINIVNEDLNDLADSIRAQGILQPIIVREIANNKYEIIAGERRWRAAQLVGLKQVPVIIREISDKAAIAIGLIENIQREELTPLEEAGALERLIKEYKMTHSEVAKAVGRSRSAVTNLIRLLQLNPQVKTLLNEKKIDMGHARTILTLKDNKQLEAVNHIIQKSLSVRQAEQLVKRIQTTTEDIIKKAKKEDSNINELTDTLAEKLHTKVQIRNYKNNKGHIIIHYNSLDELDGILKHIK